MVHQDEFQARDRQAVGVVVVVVALGRRGDDAAVDAGAPSAFSFGAGK